MCGLEVVSLLFTRRRRPRLSTMYQRARDTRIHCIWRWTAALLQTHGCCDVKGLKISKQSFPTLFYLQKKKRNVQILPVGRRTTCQWRNSNIISDIFSWGTIVIKRRQIQLHPKTQAAKTIYCFRKVESLNTENYIIIEHLVSNSYLFKVCFWDCKLCLYPINVFYSFKNILFPCGIYFIDSAILNNHFSFPKNRFDQLPNKIRPPFRINKCYRLKTGLTGLTVLSDWFSVKPLFFFYISATLPGWLGGSLIPLQHTHLS